MTIFRILGFLALVNLTLAVEPALKVTGLDSKMEFSAAELAALPHTELTVTDPHSKNAVKFSGIVVRDLLLKAGAPLGAKLRGRALHLAVLARATDGYAVVFALADFDEAFSDRTILLADAADGKPLSAKNGPLRIVVPGDKKAARWANQVISLEVVDVGGPTSHDAASPHQN